MIDDIKKTSETTSTIKDNIVVGRILKGEKELFEILLRRYNQKLYRAIRSYLNDEEEVEDIMQETYLKAYSKLAQYRGEASFSTWLIRIGINEALLRIRSLQKEQNFESATETLLHLPDQKMNPENEIINYEMRKIIEKAIDGLPEKYRIIYVLREIEGMENPEIAKCLDISDTNVKVRVHRAKALLKDSLYSLSSDTDLFEFGNIRCDRVVKYVMDRI